MLFSEMSMGSVLVEKLRSVLVDDCTRGLVGALRMKLEGNDDSDGADGRIGNSQGDLGEEGGNLASNWKGLRLEGGPGVNHGVVGEDPNGTLSLWAAAKAVSRDGVSLRFLASVKFSSCVKSPACNADRGRSISDAGTRSLSSAGAVNFGL
jgi:hypothetical protein